MNAEKERVLVVVQDEVSGFSRPVKELADILTRYGFTVRTIASGDVRVPDFNAADILLFFLKPPLKNLIEYGRAFEAFSGMNCAGRLGGLLSTGPSDILETFENTLREAEMTFVEPLFFSGLDSAGSDVATAMKNWTTGLIARYGEMKNARRSFTR